MNIFYLDNDVTECARMHVDKHCVKMILEYAQLLSTTHRVIDGTLLTGVSDKGRKCKSWILPDGRNAILYKATHINHPSAVWTRQSRDNYAWLWKLLEALCSEYTYRYGKVHKVQREGLLEQLRYLPSGVKEHSAFTEPPTCMPDDCKMDSVVESYRNYYSVHKSSMFVWKNRERPYWAM